MISESFLRKHMTLPTALLRCLCYLVCYPDNVDKNLRDKIYTDFQEAYARNEDTIRRLWDSILNEQIRLRVGLTGLYALSLTSVIHADACGEKEGGYS